MFFFCFTFYNTQIFCVSFPSDWFVWLFFWFCNFYCFCLLCLLTPSNFQPAVQSTERGPFTKLKSSILALLILLPNWTLPPAFCYLLSFPYLQSDTDINHVLLSVMQFQFVSSEKIICCSSYYLWVWFNFNIYFVQLLQVYAVCRALFMWCQTA
jgi:hypothetical protein